MIDWLTVLISWYVLYIYMISLSTVYTGIIHVYFLADCIIDSYQLTGMSYIYNFQLICFSSYHASHDSLIYILW